MPFPRIPKSQVFFADRPHQADVLERSLRILDRARGSNDGFLVLEEGDESFFGLIRAGQIVQAGQWSSGQAYDLSVSVFEHIAGRSEDGRFSLFGVEPLLFDCLQLVFTKHPVAAGSTRYLDVAELARAVSRRSADAVLSFGTASEINFAFFRAGEPLRVFPADHLAPQPTGTVLQRIERYLRATEQRRGEEEVSLQLFDRVGECLPLVHQPVADEPLPAGIPLPRLEVTVSLKGRVVRRVVLEKAVTTIGRIAQNDIVIDNLGVSREHCALVLTEDGVQLEDRGSLNGVTVNDELVRRKDLAEGDVIVIGKHEVRVGRDCTHLVREESSGPALAAYDATMLLSKRDLSLEASSIPGTDAAASDRNDEPDEEGERFARPTGPELEQTASRRLKDLERSRARLVLDDEEIELPSTSFTIGSTEDVDLKLDGFRVKRSMARIVRDGTGRFRLVRLSRVHRLRINGTSVSDEEMLLDGDEVSIGKKRFLFSAG